MNQSNLCLIVIFTTIIIIEVLYRPLGLGPVNLVLATVNYVAWRLPMVLGTACVKKNF